MNESTLTVLNFKESLRYIQKNFGEQPPRCTLVLGSGLGEVVDAFEIEQTLSYKDIPHFPKSNLQGHAGKLLLAKIHGQKVLIFAGRFHYYQGFPNTLTALPAWITGFWKIPMLITTNAAGGINASFKEGDMAVIHDHIFLQNDHPLRGVILPEWENPFIDMTTVYDEKLRNSLMETARTLKITLQTGTYICVTGPSYETPAEIKAFRTMGADMVGMSTVPEVIVARKMGIKIVGISMIANMAAGTGNPNEIITHKDVVDSIHKSQTHLSKLISAWLESIPPA